MPKQAPKKPKKVLSKKDKQFEQMVQSCVKNARNRRNDAGEQEKWRKQYAASLRQGCQDPILPPEKSPLKTREQEIRDAFEPLLAQRDLFAARRRKVYEDPEMQDRELEALKETEQKMKKVAPLFNKGGLQYSPNDVDFKEGNKRRE